MTSGRSAARESRIGLPLSSVSSAASSCMFFSIRSASLLSRRPRSRASALRQGPFSKARRAALAALLASGAPPPAARPTLVGARDHVAGGVVDGLEGAAAGRVDPLAVDEHLRLADLDGRLAA